MRSDFPYENIQSQHYPAIFATNGLTDDRVFPLEPLKWITKLRSYNKSNNPILLKTYLSKGHFSGSNKYRGIKELAEQYAFILGQFGVSKAPH